MTGQYEPEEDINALYASIMNSLDLDDGPSARPPVERRDTSDSDKLMDIYSSYDGPASIEPRGPLSNATEFKAPQLAVPSSPAFAAREVSGSSYPSPLLAPPTDVLPHRAASPIRRSRPLPQTPGSLSLPSSPSPSSSALSSPPLPEKQSPMISFPVPQPYIEPSSSTPIPRHGLPSSPSQMRNAFSSVPDMQRHHTSNSIPNGQSYPPSPPLPPPAVPDRPYTFHAPGPPPPLNPPPRIDSRVEPSDSGSKVTAHRAVSAKGRPPRPPLPVAPAPPESVSRSSSLSIPSEALSSIGPHTLSPDIMSSASSSPDQRRSPSVSSSYFGHVPEHSGTSGTLSRLPTSASAVPSSDFTHATGDSFFRRPSTSSSVTSSFTAQPPNDHGRHQSQDLYSVAGPSGLQQNYEEKNPIAQRVLGLRDEFGLREESEYEFLDDLSDPDEMEDYVESSLLSHVAVKLRDKIPRSTHAKGGIPYQGAFTGKDIVSTVQGIIQRDLPDIAADGRRTALQVARSLQAQLFFHEVEWGERSITDSVGDVFVFFDEQETAAYEREGLPTGVITSLTRCYSITCQDTVEPCFSYACPKRTQSIARVASIGSVLPEPEKERGWADGIDDSVLRALPESEIQRQTMIATIISKEAQYVKDLDLIDTLFIKPLRNATDPIIPREDLDSFIDTVFGNILDLRETNRRLLDVIYVRQREQGPVILCIGDIFLNAATEFRVVYPLYVGNLPLAESTVKEEIEKNPKFRMFVDQQARLPEARRLDLRHFITRPSEHLQKYPVLLDAVRSETDGDNIDKEYLLEATEAIRKLSEAAHLRTFQASMGRGAMGKQEWHDLAGPQIVQSLPKKEIKRQNIIFELVKGEMELVKDLELIETLFIRPLRAADLGLSDSSPRGVEHFLNEIFFNYRDILAHHRKLLDAMHTVQRDEWPCITSLVAPVYDAALNWRDAYIEYVTHYPIAVYRVEEAMSLPAFRRIIDAAQRHPEAKRMDIKFYINRPIPRILRYSLLLQSILDASPPDHQDTRDIPSVLEIFKDLGKTVNYSISSSERKVELWRYNRNLVWRPGEVVDMDLLDESRILIHTGRLFKQSEGSLDWGNGLSELFVLLFDNYLVLTKPKEKDGVTKYHVNRRPIPLTLLELLSFNDPPQQRSASLLVRRPGRGGDKAKRMDSDTASIMGDKAEPTDNRLVYGCSLFYSGRSGGNIHLFAESSDKRSEWERKLREAKGLCDAVQEATKAFEKRTISENIFAIANAPQSSASSNWTDLSGKVTCSVPLPGIGPEPLVAVGCEQGVWIGVKTDPSSMRRVLHLKQVTQCAWLREFGIFVVLADKTLLAYHIDSLVASGATPPQPSRQPQKLSGARDVQFFSVGVMNGRTLIIYMKKKGLDSVFRALEPVVGKGPEKTKTFGRMFGSRQSEWFRQYTEFFLPSDSFDLIFLKAKLAIMCVKGFEIMDLDGLESVTIPARDTPQLAQLARRCEACKPMGMFRSTENEFLLCYDEFGIYVDRHGDPSRGLSPIEWEGTARSVAFHPPYVLIFDKRFIEVRHIEKGRLVQFIMGSDLQCTWDSREPPPAGLTNGVWDERFTSGEARVHCVSGPVQSKDDHEGVGSSARKGYISQHVFELLATVPLTVPLPTPSKSPATLPSPNTPSYFQQQQRYSDASSIRTRTSETGGWR